MNHAGSQSFTDADLWAVAFALLERHGEDADVEAVVQADVCLDHDDESGRRLWLSVLKRIETVSDRNPQYLQ